MSSKAARGIAILTGRHAAGEARPASGACQMNRFRYWLLQTAAEQRFALFFHLSQPPAYKARWNPGLMMTLLVTDGNNVYPPCAKALGIKHEALNQSAGERVRGTIHIQTVNNRHSGINLNSAVGAKQSSGKLLMLNQCLRLESSTMANPFGEVR